MVKMGSVWGFLMDWQLFQYAGWVLGAVASGIAVVLGWKHLRLMRVYQTSESERMRQEVVAAKQRAQIIHLLEAIEMAKGKT